MTSTSVSVINDKVKKESGVIDAIRFETSKVMVGQNVLIDRLLIGILANGHVLVEGVPGLAKTTAVKTLAQTIQAKFHRLQFTPDMLPADLTGTLIYDQRQGTFNVKKGPIFANIILADEINRAPAKVQSALLEAKTGQSFSVQAVASPQDIIRLRSVVDEIYMDEKIEEYIVQIVEATRNPEFYKLKDLKALILYGASPRATINLALASKAHAFIQGRGFVTPQDIKSIGMDVLRHRVIPSYEAEAEGMTSEDLVKRILDEVEVP